MNQIAGGRLEDAESALSAALADRANGSEETCAWLTLHNLAVVMALSGRLEEAEVLTKRSLTILEKGYPPDDSVLLRPLQTLSQIQFELRKVAKARETFQRLQSIRTERPADRAVVHGMSAALLYAEGRYNEGEAEYLKRTGSNSSGHELSCMVGRVNGGRRKQTWSLRFRRLTTRDWTRLYSNPCWPTMRMSSAKIIGGRRLASSRRAPPHFRPMDRPMESWI
jgi:hypothetical protein